jgi:hypothetical protein
MKFFQIEIILRGAYSHRFVWYVQSNMAVGTNYLTLYQTIWDIQNKLNLKLLQTNQIFHSGYQRTRHIQIRENKVSFVYLLMNMWIFAKITTVFSNYFLRSTHPVQKTYTMKYHYLIYPAVGWKHKISLSNEGVGKHNYLHVCQIFETLSNGK